MREKVKTLADPDSVIHASILNTSILTSPNRWHIPGPTNDDGIVRF